MSISIRSLDGAPRNEIIRCFNEAFADYLIRIRLSAPDLDYKTRLENLDLSLSAGCWVNGRLSGMIFTGLDAEEHMTYNGGTGVVPLARGIGLTRRMYSDFLLPVFRKSGIRKTKLEVIVTNDPAIHIYRKIGMEVSREVICYQQSQNRIRQTSCDAPKKIGLAAWKNFQPWTWHDAEPTWQNNRKALERSWPQVQLLGYYEGGELVAYAAFHPQRGRVLQLAVKPEKRGQGLGKSLFAAMDETCTMPLTVINLDAAEPGMHAFMRAIGMRESIRQYEMVMQVPA